MSVQGEREKPIATPAHSAGRLLVLGDAPANVKPLVDLLGSHGYEVHVARSGDEALAPPVVMITALEDREARLRALESWNRRLEARVAEEVGRVEKLTRLKRFFSPQLAELIMAGGADDPLASHRREITVVFLDLRGFTAFAESAEPEEVMKALSEFHGAMGRRVLEYQGTLERFTGDGLMVFFNDPVPIQKPAHRAVEMAFAMQEDALRLSAQWKKKGYSLGLGIGIAEGYATVGAIGFEGRIDYGAIGTVTNLASRLCDLAEPGHILVSQRVHAEVEAVVTAEDLGGVQLMGFARPVHAFQLVDFNDMGVSG